MLLQDEFEPQEIESLIKQSIPVTVMPLNRTHRSDYYFASYDGVTKQFSRKQAGELLGNIDEAEDQIRDYYENADENFQIVEGIISPVPLATLTDKQYWALKGGKIGFAELRYSGRSKIPPDYISIRNPTVPPNLFPTPILDCMYSYAVEEVTDKYGESMGLIRGGHTHRVRPSLYYAWIGSLDRVGVTTFYTTNYASTANLLVSLYNNSQKPIEEHGVLQRVIKPRIHIHQSSPKEKQRYNYIKTVMSLVGAELGETKATQLIDYFGNPFSLYMAEVEDIAKIEGFGKKTAEKIMRAIGKEV